MSDPSAMLRAVDRVDGVRVFRRMLPRRWKRYIGVAALTVMVVRPDLTAQAAGWLWEERAKRAAAIVTGTFLPSGPPSPALPPAAEDHAHG